MAPNMLRRGNSGIFGEVRMAQVCRQVAARAKSAFAPVCAEPTPNPTSVDWKRHCR